MGPVRIIFRFLVSLSLALLKRRDRPLHLVPCVVDQAGGIGIDADLFHAIEHREQLLEMAVGLFVQVGFLCDLTDPIPE